MGYGLGDRIIPNLRLPDYPVTVELILTGGSQTNLDPGGEQAGAALLTALGFPVTTCAPDYRGNLRTSKRQWAVTAVVVIVLLAALFGYGYYMSHRVRTGY